MDHKEHKGGATKAVGPVILSGLLAQVGAVLPDPRARRGQLPQGHCWPEGRMGLDAPHSPARA